MNKHQKLDDLEISLVDLQRQPGAMDSFTFNVEIPEDLKVYDVEVTSSEVIDVDVNLTSVSEGVLVDLRTNFEAISQCYRCLEDVAQRYDVSVQELYYYPGMREKAIAEGDETADEMYEIENDTVDLGALLRDSIILELPMRMLCDEDCEGICPHCAIPFAELEEGHTHEIIDDRWQGLADLAKKMQERDNGE
ncbi:DUF177 domain-containing protein [Actinomyces sp. zg-332]|uniref:YceD family protein n=1 Tax=Actinomyces sp. zg-332 TaxID=2708340 RepID=UPI0018C213A3|nr:YceD family protein [Actinomyces sp. zg-332]QPK94449.1 DUF177 domain-containing protein [Actinomyces sp. zg-332]